MLLTPDEVALISAVSESRRLDAVPVMQGLTAEEQFRIYGSVDPDMMPELLDAQATLDGLNDSRDQLKEVKAQFPNEDFLQEAITELNVLLKSVRGDNKTWLTDTINKIEEIQRAQALATEHALDLLNKMDKEWQS